MSLSRHFELARPKTIQLELSGGGALGRYECGALVELIPFWKSKGYQVKIITGVSAGAMNSVLTSYALNTGQDHKLEEIYNAFWHDVARKGDLYLKPLLDFHAAANTFNPFKNKSNDFPNVPRRLIDTMSLSGKSSLPLTQLKELLIRHIPKDGWSAIQNGSTETYVSTIRKTDDTRHPVIFTGADLTPEKVVASGALRDFAEYRLEGDLYEDGGYHNIGFFLKDKPADVLFAIGLKPLRNTSEIEDHRGVKTGQLHHDLARYYIDAQRKCHIDFLCLDSPEYWNETAALNNTSRHLDALYNKGQEDAKDWILNNDHTFGQKSSFTPSPDLLKFIHQSQELRAA